MANQHKAWSQDENADLARLRDLNWTLDQIAAYFGRSYDAVRSQIRRLKLPAVAGGPRRRAKMPTARIVAPRPAKAPKPRKVAVSTFQAPLRTVVPVAGVVSTAEAVRRAAAKLADAQAARDATRASLAAMCQGEQRVRECRGCSRLFVSEHVGHRMCCGGTGGVMQYSLAGAVFR